MKLKGKIGEHWFSFSSWIENNFKPLELFLTAAGIAVAAFLLFETREQVRVSKSQIDSTGAYSRKELRPYLYITEFIDDSLYAKGYRMSNFPSAIRFRVSNSGQTPAYDFRIHGFVYRVKKDSIPPNPRVLKVEENMYIHPILPKDGVPVYCEFIQKSIDGYIPFLTGKISYTDTFGKSHIMVFSYQYIWERDEWYPYPGNYNDDYDE